MSGLLGRGKSTSTKDTIINSISVQQSAYGLAIALLFGKNRVAGNLIYYSDLTPIPHTSTSSSGGKGGKSTTSNTTYTYTAALMIALGEGVISEVTKVWSNSTVTTLSALGLDFYTGADDQPVWPWLLSKYPGTDRAIPYRGTAYVASGKYDLGSGTSLPNLNFEGTGLNSQSSFKGDAIITDIIDTLITNTRFGVTEFPSSRLGDLTRLRDYTVANGIFASPSYTSQDQLSTLLTDLCQIGNAQPVWSQGVLKFVPYSLESAQGNGATYTASTDVEYDLTTDDLVADEGEDPITFNRSDTSDAYNHQPIEFSDRSNDYNTDTDFAEDLANIDDQGRRTADVVTLHAICERSIAKIVAQNILNRELYVRNTWTFKLSWKYCGLEPMDLVSMTIDELGLNRALFRILTIDDDDSYTLTITAEEVYGSTSGVDLHPTQDSNRPTSNYNIDPGNVNPPVIWEAPGQLITTDQGIETWFGASGGPSWGGCFVWIANDSDENFKRIGEITSPCRQGIISSLLSKGLDPDQINTVGIDLTECKGSLIGGTKADADTFNTLSNIGGELVSYQNATLTSIYNYRLSYLRRGIYDTYNSDHPVDSKFFKVDKDRFFKYPMDSTNIGKTFHVKFTSYNIYGASEQSLANVVDYTHIVDNVNVPQVSGLKIIQHLRGVLDGTNMYELDVSWTPPDSILYSYSNVYMKTSQPNWDDDQMPDSIADVGDNSLVDMTNVTTGVNSWKYLGKANDKITITGCATGQTFTVKVQSVSLQKNFMADFDAAPTITHEVKLKSYFPQTPDNFTVEFTDVCTWSWDENSDTDNDFYEVREDTNVGILTNRIAVTSSNKAIGLPSSRSGTAYLYAHNTSGHYSFPATLQYNKVKPIAPTVTVNSIFQGLLITTNALPSTILGISVHANDGTGEVIYTSVNNSYTLKAKAGIFSIQVAFYDLFGEGNLSDSKDYTILPTIDPALIAAESLSLEKMDKTIKDAVAAAQVAIDPTTFYNELAKKIDDSTFYDAIAGKVSYTEFTDKTNTLVQVDETNASAIQQASYQITSTVAILNSAPGATTQYTAISQLKQTADGLSTTVINNKNSQDALNTQYASAIQQNSYQITSTVEILNGNPGDTTQYNAISQLKQTADGLSSTIQTNQTYQNGQNSGFSSQITQNATQITSVVTELNKSYDTCGYTAIAQSAAAIQLRAKSANLISLINVCPEAITIDSKYIHITGTTVFDDSVIVGRMLEAQSVTADKLSVTSLSAVSAVIGTLRNATTGARTEISDNLIQVFDTNNTLRVRIGVFD